MVDQKSPVTAHLRFQERTKLGTCDLLSDHINVSVIDKVFDRGQDLALVQGALDDVAVAESARREVLVMLSAHEKRSRGFLLCFFGSVPSSSTRNMRAYCSGVSVPAQVDSVLIEKRTTPSPVEQKERTPVWFATSGFAHTA